VEPFLRAGCRVAFYRIRRDLSLDYADLAAKLRHGAAAVLVIHYCGFPVDLQPILEMRKQANANWFLIEDWAHSFLDAASGQLNGGQGDMTVYSFYKHVPTFTGGGLRISRPGLAFRPVAAGIPLRHSADILKKLVGQSLENAPHAVVKGLWQSLDRKRNARKRHPHFENGPSHAPTPYTFDEALAQARMPAVSRLILRMSDWPTLIKTRRDLFRLWSTSLREDEHVKKLHASLPDTVCPWAYPILLANRSTYDFQLRERGVPLFTFGETLHPLLSETDQRTFDDASYLSTTLLMLAVHQGLSREQVRTSATTINAFFEGSV
jgi:dTDP-4-amino-4,6-dideoxygalactose transaminase